jgi:ComF family protein
MLRRPWLDAALTAGWRELDAFGSGLLDLIWPWLCVSCEASGPPVPGRFAAWLCEGCAASLPRLGEDRCERCAAPLGPYAGVARACPECRDQRFVARSHALYSYEGEARQLVCRLKYRREGALAEAFADALAPRLTGSDVDLIVPVPMHWARRLQRGANQAELLGRALARRLSIGFDARALTRRRSTPALHSLSRDRRRAVLTGAFAARRSRLAGRRVLLVDDLRTTGTTITECSRALRDAGATHVEAAFVAVRHNNVRRLRQESLEC